jgi:hypothetical protein
MKVLKCLFQINNKLVNILILLLPIFLLISINEYSRAISKERGFVRKGITGINSGIKTREKCSWSCHRDMQYCKKYHTKISVGLIKKIDPIYFGIIKRMYTIGDYGLANIIFLVFLFPLSIIFIDLKSNITWKKNILSKKYLNEWILSIFYTRIVQTLLLIWQIYLVIPIMKLMHSFLFFYTLS